jgi:hypothetical protein
VVLFEDTTEPNYFKVDELDIGGAGVTYFFIPSNQLVFDKTDFTYTIITHHPGRLDEELKPVLPGIEPVPTYQTIQLSKKHHAHAVIFSPRDAREFKLLSDDPIISKINVAAYNQDNTKYFRVGKKFVKGSSPKTGIYREK